VDRSFRVNCARPSRERERRRGSDHSGNLGYAKEDLGAEIASLVVGDQPGIGHDPARHAACVKSYVQVPKDGPKETLRASRAADKIGN
jgi:antirestriction protein ArdC